MAELPDSFYVHRAAVRTVAGHDAYGELYEESYEFPCFISHKRHFIQGATERTLSQAVIRCDLRDEDRLLEDSEITLHTERPRSSVGVISGVSANTDGDIGAWQHLRVEVGRGRE